MIIKDDKQLETLKKSGHILAEVLNLVASKVEPGISAYELDQIAEREIKGRGANPSFQNYKSSPDDVPFPSSLCVSINSEVVHGVPKKTKILKNGDIVSLDLGVEYRGFYTDAAITVPVGQVDKKLLNLIEVTRLSLENALKIVKAGTFVGNIGHAIESTAKYYGFPVVRELVGHGVGASVHEDPEVPCFGIPGTGPIIKDGMVLAIEPMVNMGKARIVFDRDGWTVKTHDGMPSAHFEHTILVTKSGCEIITKL
ncbi:MAG: type I methionyl aminopeptidase [Candidatus Doudnabacteria bacterium]|nr:type I methionyl aminopeptidase [Candidatus Doudnabacteria bacterium]